MENKLFFSPGDVVKVKHNIPNVPNMYVVKKAFGYNIKDSDKAFNGMLCRWFSSDHKLQEGIFNTKDLELGDI